MERPDGKNRRMTVRDETNRIRKIDESLMEACRRGLTDAVRFLLSRDVNVNAGAMAGPTPLQEACAHGHTVIARMLIEKGAVVDGHDNMGQTPLHAACANGHVDTVRMLLEQEIDPVVIGEILDTEPPLTGEVADMLHSYMEERAMAATANAPGR